MAAQLGKLRQWAGEVIAPAKDKVVANDEFTELERDIDLRKEGAIKLHGACEAYQQALSKKKVSEAAGDSEKVLPIDALGMVMVSHGEQFPEESQFGRSLVNLGRAHSVIATLQETYAVQFKETFIAAIEQFREEIKELEALRKQLDSRRSALESATAKYEKTRNSKKDKDKREAEDDLERAQQRYDETIEDMRAHMHAIQENEIAQERELSAFLDLEINFVQQHLDVLKDVRKNWPSGSGSRVSVPSRRSRASTTPILPSRAISSGGAPESSEDERPPSRNSLKAKHRKSESTGSRGPSRPSSRLSRRRTNSSAASSKEKSDKEEAKPRRLSVAGWASTAVDSLANRNKKSKDRDTFASLDDDADADIRNGAAEAPPHARKNSFSLSRKHSKKSKENISGLPPLGHPRILKPPSLQDRKTVKAMYDFNGSADELSFKAGTEIKVLNEVVEGWWMGEIEGKKGLFPTSYVSSSPRVSPQLPPRPYRPEEDDVSQEQKPGLYGLNVPRDEDYLTSDLEELTRPPLSHNRSPVYAVFNDAPPSDHPDDTDTESPKATKPSRRFSDDLDMYMESSAQAKSKATTTHSTLTPKMRNRLLPRNEDVASQPLLRSQSDNGPPSPVADRHTQTTPKRMPPPPPPRRTPAPSSSSTPAIPERKLGPAVPPRPPMTSNPPFPSRSSFESTSSGPFNDSNSSLSAGHGDDRARGLDYDVSPFESAAELPVQGTGTVGCSRFHANPFYPKGMCSNCKVYHS